MGAKLRVVRRRIRSVQSTAKITRAMELIAASRIVKAQQRVFEARPYADLLTAAMEDVARQTGSLVHPLLEEREAPQRAGVLVMTSDSPAPTTRTSSSGPRSCSAACGEETSSPSCTWWGRGRSATSGSAA
jgi:hypothetical protein